MLTHGWPLGRGLVLILSVWPAAAFGQGIIEDFTTPLNASDGVTLGSAGQLTVRLFGAGAFTAGAGQGVLFAPNYADSALLSGTEPLPSGPYELRFSYNGIYLPGVPSWENAAVLLGVYDWAPRPASSAAWLARGVLEVVALERLNDATGRYDHLIAIYYWDDALSGRAFDGNTWQAMGPVHAAEYTPDSAYEVHLERTASEYVVTISSGSTVVTSATIPLSTARHVGDAWIAAGFPRTDQGLGALALSAAELPPPSAYPDGGPGPEDAGPDLELLDAGPDAIAKDAAARDASPDLDTGVDDAGAADTRPALDTAPAPLDAAASSDVRFSGTILAESCECDLRGRSIDPAKGLAPLVLLAVCSILRRRLRR